MKPILRIIISFLLLLVHQKLLAQAICATDEMHASLLLHDQNLKLRSSELEIKIADFIRLNVSKRTQENVYTIPVVVHVLHTGGEIGSIYNPTEEQIIATIAHLNSIYDGTNPSLTPMGEDAAGDIGIRFALAKRDPDCNPTNGINRVNMSSNAKYQSLGFTSNNIADDIAFKYPIVWDRDNYYNIYVVNKIDGKDGTSGQFVGGYAHFPTMNKVDGTVILATQMKPEFNTLPHELGHAFHLYHPFQGSPYDAICPLNPNGDYVDDTDPITYNMDVNGIVDYTCRTGFNICANKPYSIRTESNIMGYNNCNTLFTPGQRERIRAVLNVTERKTLIQSKAWMATNEEPGCPAKINFEKIEDSIALFAANANGCKPYKDFEYVLTIGNKPIQQTIANIVVNNHLSTAREGVDFDFPKGKTIVFPAGSNLNQRFLIRVYDNGVNNEKKIDLNLEVPTNSGNAEQGSAAANLNIKIRSNDRRPLIIGSRENTQIGDNQNRLVTGIFNSSSARQKTQVLYTREELLLAGLSAGTITQLTINIDKKSSRPFRQLAVKMKNASGNSLVQNGIVSPETELQTVFYAAAYTTLNGRNTFNFNQGFEWDGRSALVVEICFNNGSEDHSESGDALYYYYDGSRLEDGNMIESQVGCGEFISSASFLQSGLKPLIGMMFTRRGNPVATQLMTSSASYLGPFGEAYFYDNDDRTKIIAHLKNLTDFDYGCTEVKIDREGISTVGLLNYDSRNQITQKTFFVLPERNTRHGRVEVTLYYTNQEKFGYELNTGNVWENTMLIGTSIPVEQITPENYDLKQINVTESAVHDSFGNDVTIKGIVAAELNGFSTGILPQSALPVDWLVLEARFNDKKVSLQWATASEKDNDRFEVEYSRDGIQFEKFHEQKGNGTTIHESNYTLSHVPAFSGTLYYRVKQIDYNGRYSYSKITRIAIPSLSEAYALYPVPANNELTVDFGEAKRIVHLTIYGSDGKVYLQHKVENVSFAILSIAKLSAGNYFIRIQSDRQESVVKKFLKR